MPIPTPGEVSDHIFNLGVEKRQIQIWLDQAIAADNVKAIYTYESKIASIEHEEVEFAAGNYAFNAPMSGYWPSFPSNPNLGFS
jgi:hypothetical protein|tara:strand:- start:39378 stop:39629 length:252 start_codon:yes stop_codon:yes gene_type:complete